MKIRLAKGLVAGLAGAALVLAALPAQAGTFTWTDPAGDATEIGVADGVPNDAAFDVTEVKMDSSGGKLSWSAKVPDVASGQPTLSSGYYFRFWFTHDGKDFQFIVAEDVTGAKTFSMSTVGTPSVTLTDACKNCKGEINREGKAVQIEAPLASLDAAMKLAEAGPVAGKDFTGLEVLAQRRMVAATLTADTAAAPEGATFTV